MFSNYSSLVIAFVILRNFSCFNFLSSNSFILGYWKNQAYIYHLMLLKRFNYKGRSTLASVSPGITSVIIIFQWCCFIIEWGFTYTVVFRRQVTKALKLGTYELCLLNPCTKAHLFGNAFTHSKGLTYELFIYYGIIRIIQLTRWLHYVKSLKAIRARVSCMPRWLFKSQIMHNLVEHSWDSWSTIHVHKRNTLGLSQPR